MYGPTQLRALVQKLTFLLSGVAFFLGVASAYVAPAGYYSADDEHQVVPADVSEEMGESNDSLGLEDDVDGWLDHPTLIPLHPPALRGVLGRAPSDRLPPSPFLDPLLRPPCFA
jgi:hypothetical protein